MAITNPRKKFNFRVFFPQNVGMPTFSVQTLKIGDSEIETVEHGFGNTILNTAGLSKPGKVTFDRLLPAGGSAINVAVSNLMWEWQREAQDPITQTGGDPSQYKKVVQVAELHNDGSTIINTWYLVGAWPSLINGREFDRLASENTVESVELTVDYISLDVPPGYTPV